LPRFWARILSRGTQHKEDEMTITDLIEELEYRLDLHGDMVCYLEVVGLDDTPYFMPVGGVSVEKEINEKRLYLSE